MRNITFFLALLALPFMGCGQEGFYTDRYQFTEADTLRGSLLRTRACYDVTHYALDIRINPDERSIKGFVDMAFVATEEFLTLQFDLYENMGVDKVVRLSNGAELETRRRFNAVFANMGERIPKGQRETLRIYYSGKPTVARRAPWDGGFVWGEDEEGRPWIGVACEGDGASLWWPNKDHLSEEPDSMRISVEVPSALTCVANGQLRDTRALADGYTRYDWAVTYPINNYNVTVNIAHYAHFAETYTAGDGEELDLDYYVLDYNLEKAKKHFKQVHPTLSCFEHYFGKYPFWDDGYALVETPYLGMEHQGAIAYGNQYLRGYMGGMIPDDMDFDYIIVHETGHEYFGNSISCNDHAEMWLHESFTTYMEALFVECAHGYADAVRYLNHQRGSVRNAEPIIGPMDVNWTRWRTSDHYYKGAWVLHTLRHAINNDSLWFDILRDFHEENRIKNLKSEDFFQFIKERTGKDYDAFFQQYLYHAGIPVFEYSLKKKRKKYVLKYRWKADVEGFDMPLGVALNGQKFMLRPTTKWQTSTLPRTPGTGDFTVLSRLFLIDVSEQ